MYLESIYTGFLLCNLILVETPVSFRTAYISLVLKLSDFVCWCILIIFCVSGIFSIIFPSTVIIASSDPLLMYFR
jgi:hypothetical protein